MNLRLRQSKPDDDENVSKAVNLIGELMCLNENIETSLWCSGLIFSIILMHKESGFPFELMKQQINQGLDYYRSFYESE